MSKKMLAFLLATTLIVSNVTVIHAEDTTSDEVATEAVVEEEKEEVKRLSFAVLMMQGIATSIDALSVGFTTAGYGLVMAVVCSLIVAVVTFVICETGLCLGKTLGTKLSGKADVLGGVILIGIGIVSWGRGM